MKLTACRLIFQNLLTLVSGWIASAACAKSLYRMQPGILIIFLVLVSYETYSQPTVLYTSLTSTTPASVNNRFDVNYVSIFKQCRFQANQSGNYNWAFSLGTPSLTDYSICWRPYTSGNVMSYNTFIKAGWDNGAHYNTSGGGSDGQINNIQNGSCKFCNEKIAGVWG